MVFGQQYLHIKKEPDLISGSLDFIVAGLCPCNLLLAAEAFFFLSRNDSSTANAVPLPYKGRQIKNALLFLYCSHVFFEHFASFLIALEHAPGSTGGGEEAAITALGTLVANLHSFFQ